MTEAAVNTVLLRPGAQHDVTRNDYETAEQDARLDRLRYAAEQTGQAHAEQCVRVVFEDLHDPHDTAKRLIMHRGLDDDDDTDIILLAVRDHDDALLWWRDLYAEHPDVLRTGRERPERDLDEDEVIQLELLLQDAYDQRGQRVLDSPRESDFDGLDRYTSWDLLEAYRPGPVAVVLDALAWEAPPVTHQPQVPTREEVKAALAARPGQPVIVARHDRAARAQAMVSRIRGGQEYGPGHLAVYRQVGSEHRVYAMFAPHAGLDEQIAGVWRADCAL